MPVRGACKETWRVVRKHLFKRLCDDICKLVVRNLIPDVEIIMSVGLQDAPRLFKSLNLVGKEHHPELAGHSIEALIVEWQFLCVSHLPFGPMVLPHTGFGMLKHWRVEIPGG